MDYLRQQIEASLGRSEELLISDKARQSFYRYPPDPGPSKKSSKDRGTFNSVRLKKYFGLGSKRKQQKLDSDDLQQQRQQQAYLEELQHYGRLPTVPLYYEGVPVPLYPHQPPHPPPPSSSSSAPPPPHRAVCYKEPWMYGSGTVSSGRTGGRYPNVYASVNVRSGGGGGHRQRGALQNAICAWEPYLQSPPVRSELPPTPEMFECPCTCDNSLQKSKKHRNKCTCNSGTKSRRMSKHSQRPSLTGCIGGADHIRYSNLNTSQRNDRMVPSSTSNNISNSGNDCGNTKSYASGRTPRLSDIPSQRAFDYEDTLRSRDTATTAKRRSILECPINPYDLITSEERFRRRSAPPRIIRHYEEDEDNFDDYDDDYIKSRSVSSRKNVKEPHDIRNRINLSKNEIDMKKDEEDVANISLGGQRIWLFGTVRGTMSIGSSSPKRPLLPSFSVEPLPSKPVNEKRSSFTSYVDFCAMRPQNSIKETSEKPIINSQLQIGKKSRQSSEKNEWDEDRRLLPITNGIIAKQKSNDDDVQLPKHKTTITIGRNVSEEEERDRFTNVKTVNDRLRAHAVSVVMPMAQEPALMSRSSVLKEEPKEDSANDVVYDVTTPTCQTVIAVGQETPTARHSRLNLKINFTELSAYLKPILKKASLNESSTSSEADTSESFRNCFVSKEPVVDLRQKQKKHVHFLSNRTSASSEVSLESSAADAATSEEDAVLIPDASEDHCEEVIQSTSSSSSSSSSSPLDDNLKVNCSVFSNDDDESDSSESSRDLYDDVLCLSKDTSSRLDTSNGQNVVSASSQRFGREGLISTAAAAAAAPTTPITLTTVTSIPQRNNFGKQVTTVKLGTLNHHHREVESLVSSVSDWKHPTNLRRSQSERQVAFEDPSTATESHKNCTTPTRSNSFLCVPSSSSSSNKIHNAAGDVVRQHRLTTPTSGQLSSSSSSKSSSHHIRNHSGGGGSDGNNSDVHCQNKLLTFCSTNNLNSPSTTDSRKRYNNEKDVSRRVFYEKNNFKATTSDESLNVIATSQGASNNNNNNNRHLSKEPTEMHAVMNSSSSSSKEEFVSSDNSHLGGSGGDCNGNARHQHHHYQGVLQQMETTGPMDIAKLRAIPKFLPRPLFHGKHVPVCSLYTSDNLSEEVGEIVTESQSSSLESDWQSEEDLYTDGASMLDRKCNNQVNEKPLPLPPSLFSEEDIYPPSTDENCDDSAIYEQIGDSIEEPLYEEVPDTISYSSASSGSGSLGQPRKSIFEGASRTEILSYLEDAKERGLESIDSTEEPSDSFNAEDEDEEDEEHPEDLVESSTQSLGTKRNHRNRISNISNLSDSSHTSEESFQNEDSKDTKDRHSHSSAEVERNDSGVGSETSKPSRLRRQSRLGSSEQICVDCDQNLEPTFDSDGAVSVDALVCRKCSKKRSERKEIILEIFETEIKYGRDLKIIKEEFHRPMLVAGLLSEDLLNNIFLNLDQLIEVNELFGERLKDALDIAVEQGDEDYSTVNVGKVFQDSSAMLHSFEAYCVRQGTASLLLTNLEKEKELLRIFLKVSQMENTLLRRLNLNSFLMVPVQRVTKYPLLLNRLYKVTPHHHQDRESLREAQLKIELHLEHINQQTKDFSGMNLWRRISNISNTQRKNLLEPVLGNMKLRKMALQILQWNTDDARFVLEGRLLYCPVTDNIWSKREKTIKLIPVHGLLITLGTPNSNYRPDLADRDLLFPRNTGIRETSLVLIKEKGSRFNLLREPLHLQRCVISTEPDSEDIFEIQDVTTKDAYLLKAEDSKDTPEWLKLLRYHAKDLGAWRRRRNALANIMINGMVARSEWL